uniref:Uncharacterized protein n=1 Tax=Planktothricoides sp. SpSt-374 TaxID=2282167 RepID=A0A7C3ZN46_9CYAN
MGRSDGQPLPGWRSCATMATSRSVASTARSDTGFCTTTGGVSLRMVSASPDGFSNCACSERSCISISGKNRWVTLIRTP